MHNFKCNIVHSTASYTFSDSENCLSVKNEDLMNTAIETYIDDSTNASTMLDQTMVFHTGRASNPSIRGIFSLPGRP